MGTRASSFLLVLLLLGGCQGPAPGFGGSGGAGGSDPGEGGSGGAILQPPRCPPLTRFEHPACGSEGCWEYPLPAPLDVEQGAVDAEGGLWLAGQGTAPLRWDGESFRVLAEGLPSPASRVTSLHAGGATPHLVQDGRLYRLEGERWSEVERGRFAFAPSDVWEEEGVLWLAGPEVRRNDGGGWESLPVVGYGPFHALWGQGGGIWAAGAQGAIFRWEEGNWTLIESGTANGLRSVWGSSMREVWFGGEAGTLLRWSGDGIAFYGLQTGATIHAIAGTGPKDVLALGYDATSQAGRLFHWNGAFWRELPPAQGLEPLSLWTSDEGVWVGGAGAGLGLWTGGCLRIKQGERSSLHDLWGGEWALGDRGLLLRRTNEGWERQPIETDSHLRRAWFWGDELWVVGDGGALFRGGEEGFRPVHGPGERDLSAIHGSEGGPLWIGARDGSLFLGDGRSLRRIPSPTRRPIHSILAFADEAWATTEAGELLRWDGYQWRFERQVFGRPTLFGTAPDDVWLAGFEAGEAVFEHWDGSRWEVATAGGVTTVHALVGDGDELYVGHAPGMIRRWDGESWTVHHLGLRPRALAHDGEDLWILTERRLHRWRDGAVIETHTTSSLLTALHADGKEIWVGTASGEIGRLEDEGLVFGHPVAEHPIRSISGKDGILWAAGDRATLLRFDGDAWEKEPLGSEADLREVRVVGDRIWIASSEGLLYRHGGAWHWYGGAPPDLRTLWTEGQLIYVASAQGGVYALDPEESGIHYTVHPSLKARAIWRSDDGQLWFGGEPLEDGTHFLRFDGAENFRIDLGVTLSATAATAYAEGEALVARDEQLFVLDPQGKRRSIGAAFGTIRSFSRQDGDFLPFAIGSRGGILRLNLVEYAPLLHDP